MILSIVGNTSGLCHPFFVVFAHIHPPCLSFCRPQQIVAACITIFRRPYYSPRWFRCKMVAHEIRIRGENFMSTTQKSNLIFGEIQFGLRGVQELPEKHPVFRSRPIRNQGGNVFGVSDDGKNVYAFIDVGLLD